MFKNEYWSETRQILALIMRHFMHDSSSQLISNVVSMQHQIWYDFDPHIDLQIGELVGMYAIEGRQENGEMFWVAKVLEVKKVAREDGKFFVLWYWPNASRGLCEGPNAM